MTIAAEVRPIGDLVPYARNARKHPPEQVRQIASLIREFGWTNPILADGDGIVAGHGRQLAARLIYDEGGTIRLPNGHELPAGTVPVIDCSGWSDAQRRAYILADNASALSSTWDDDLLKLELSFLEGSGFDLTLTGFDSAALEAALGAGAGGDKATDPLKVSLSDRFGIPPFSVLNAREGWWQDRKRAWLSLGIQSELGRGEGVDGGASPGGSPRPLDRMKAAKANATPGGAAMPAANYGKTKARGDGRGRAVQTNDLRGGLTHRTTTDPYRKKAPAHGEG